ncbi:MAG: MBL fold metallo-hydrolase [Deltaproteobacteria bacterium]|nr:MBL fold metallo-hydrolase [Deltaproteobacteria bacterium]
MWKRRAAAILSATGAKLAVHRLEAKRLSGLFTRGLSKVLGGAASPRPDRLLADGDALDFGKQTLTVLHTPGHTPGGICLYTPGHVFTGDTLFVGSVGRTDLPGGSTATLLSSIRRKLYTLPPETIVWPGHHYGRTPTSTIAREMAENPFTR